MMAMTGMPHLYCPMVEELGLPAVASLCWDMEVANHRMNEGEVWSPQPPLACLPNEDWTDSHLFLLAELFEEAEGGSCCPMSSMHWGGGDCLPTTLGELQGIHADYLGNTPSPAALRFPHSPPTSSLGSDSQSEVYESDLMLISSEESGEPLLPGLRSDMDDDSGESGGSSPREGQVDQGRTLSQTPRSGNTTSQRRKPGRKKGQVSRVLHLWEFIRDLLRDPQYCPSIIKWENKAQGIFRVVKSAEVARLWGEKKKNKKEMTYEKMSRSLRYSRKEGFFVDIPKESGFPRKLCFKFGERSYGWH